MLRCTKLQRCDANSIQESSFLILSQDLDRLVKTFRVECGIFHFAIQEGLTESAYENWMRCDVATPDFFGNMLQRCALLKDIERPHA